MTKLRLVAICGSGIEAEFARDPALVSRFGFLAIRHLDLTAVTVPVKKYGFFASKRDVLSGEISQLQTSMEALQDFGPLIGAQHGTDFVDEIEALGFLAGNHAELSELMQSAGDFRQFQIDVTWKPAEALMAYGNHEAIQHALKVSPDAPNGGRAIALTSAMDEIKANLKTSVGKLLATATPHLIEQPTLEAEAVASFIVAIKPHQEPTLDRAVEAIDASAPDLYHISYRGPLPAVSFACLSVAKPDQKELDKARKLLGLGKAFAAAEVEEAFKAFIKRNHPDVGGDAHLAELGKKSRDLLVDVALFEVRSLGTRSEPSLLVVNGEGINSEAVAA
ncbi:MAG: GvpL/GvpF family gas vesicle protein [Pseudomonadota bacterium]